MKLENQLSPHDQKLVSKLHDFVPNRVFDAHAHLQHADHFAPDNGLPFLPAGTGIGWEEYREQVLRWLPATTLEALFFGFPRVGNDRPAINEWLQGEANKSPGNRALALTSAGDDPQAVAAQIEQLGMVGMKPYHIYAERPDTMNASLEEFVPEWMWEICHGINGVLMIHLVRERALADEGNQKALRRLCLAYPNCRVVLAHVARSFNYRHGLEGLRSMQELDNVWVDTSAVCEAPAMREAIRVLGSHRVLFGTDYPVSNFRGTCTAAGDSFAWLYSDTAPPGTVPPGGEMTYVGLESLLGLREACEDSGLTTTDVQDIFYNNAQRLLAPHLLSEQPARSASGPERWSAARNKISGGTGLLSKRAEMFDPATWPSYFSRCSGCEVWDMEGRHFIDFAGGVGAILLGYADPDVTRAVRRRLDLGTYCTLVSPDEPELAELLLDLHPWASRVRYARGGGEALGIAVRIARAATNRSGIAFCGYHGWQDWYLAANLGDSAALDGHLLPGLEPLGVPRELRGTSVGFRYNDLASFEEALDRMDGRLAAVVMEPMRYNAPENDFLHRVAKRCRDAGGVFIVDEVTSGWRYGFPGALANFELDPDIAVYAKAMSNGFPCAAVVGRSEVMDAANASFISSSYWTDGVGPAAALASIRKMRDMQVQQLVWHVGESVQARLKALGAKHPSTHFTLRGMPCSQALSFDLGENATAAKTLMIRRMLQHGFLMSSAMYLMLAHTEEHISGMLAALDETLGEIGELVQAGTLQDAVGSNGATVGFARLN